MNSTMNSSAQSAVVAEPFRLISIVPSAAPGGGAGDDWLTYRIAQGANLVTGYRQGGPVGVTAEVLRLVDELNQRLAVNGHRFSRVRRVSKAPTRSKNLL